MIIILKRRIESAKFGVVFPEETELWAFEDMEKRIFVQHPKKQNIYTSVAKKDIKTILK